jgi:mono/diheme cytochrome c family protein
VNLAVVLSLLAVLVVLRFVPIGLLAWIGAWFAAMYVFFQYGFKTPIPSSAVQMYLAIVGLALCAYATSSRERAQQTFGPIVEFASSPRYTLPLVAVALVIPGLVAWSVYRGLQQPIRPPYFGRTVHPSPPSEITVHGEKIDLLKGENPLRKLEKTDEKAFQQHVASGRNIYYANCFYCHGDYLAGNGMYAHGLSPLPANFQDSGVLPNFQETFFFWRVAKGGPGMPDEGGPGDSAMPEWERFLTNEQMWEVVLFLYTDTGYRPRSWEEAGHAEAAH